MFFRRARIVPRSQELVFLDADDDLGTIRSKLESSSAEEIYLAAASDLARDRRRLAFPRQTAGRRVRTRGHI